MTRCALHSHKNVFETYVLCNFSKRSLFNDDSQQRAFDLVRLFYAERVGLLDGEQQLLVEDLQRGVRWQIQAVEARVGARQTVGFAPFFYAELARSYRPSQRCETFVRYAGRTRNKLD